MESGNNKRVIAFIDASNIIYGCTREGWALDLEKFLKYLQTRHNAKRVLYYGGVDSDNKKQLKFYELLQRLGYELRLVPMKSFSDGTKKADIDSRMTLEIMRYFDEYDGLIVCTGDGDFFWVLEYLVEELNDLKPVRLMSHSSSTARELKQLLGHRFIPLSNIRHIIERK